MNQPESAKEGCWCCVLIIYFVLKQSKSMSFRKIVVGVSGGVDSAVAAMLLKKKGYDVSAVFMKNWDIIDETGSCLAARDLEDARWACRKLNIPLTEVDFVKEYWNYVFSQLLSDYESGFTPNPDVLCNRYIKFNRFIQHAQNNFSADAIATGHYALTSFGPYLEHFQPDKDVRLLKSHDKMKDQTFFLCGIRQSALRRVMFPLGNLLKKDVKKLAEKAGLIKIAKKRESTGICFVGKRDFQGFIKEYLPAQPGNFIDIDTGAVVGSHNGIHMWTVGQGARISGSHKPFFILRKLPPSPDILVAAGTDHPSLFTRIIFAEKPTWICESENPIKNGLLRCEFRFQHTKPLQPCYILSGGGSQRLTVLLDKPIRAITPGQYAVFYHNDECLGGAKITSPGPSEFALKPGITSLSE